MLPEKAGLANVKGVVKVKIYGTVATIDGTVAAFDGMAQWLRLMAQWLRLAWHSGDN